MILNKKIIYCWSPTYGMVVISSVFGSTFFIEIIAYFLLFCERAFEKYGIIFLEIIGGVV